MNITINIFVLGTIVILALMGGFWVGRSIKWMMADTESRIENADGDINRDINKDKVENMTETPTKFHSTVAEEHNSRKLKNTAHHISYGEEIGSPVSGIVRGINDGLRKGALIQPEKGLLYAPASGKIIRLYPMGNAMRLRTDSGMELLLRVGENGDELHSVYYRSYVVQNEIVTKGKLLLEFDMEGMYSEGIDTAVTVMVDTADVYPDITITRKGYVKVGDELFVCDIHRE